MKKKWLLGLLALCASFAFICCGENNNGDDNVGGDDTNIEQDGNTDNGENANGAQTPEKPEGEKEEETPVKNIAFDEFMSDYSHLALDLANTHLKIEILQDKEALSETWGFHANEEDELDSVSLTYTYKVDDTVRALEVANATFTNPIDLDKIVENQVSASDLTHAISRETAFTFDAKDLYQNADFASTLIEYVSQSENPKYFTEIESTSSGIRHFRVAEQTPDVINVYNLRVVGSTDQEIISNLSVSYNNEITGHATYPLGDNGSATIIVSEYEMEEFTPENVEEAVKDFSTEIAAALDANFLQKTIEVELLVTFDANKLQSYTWDIGDGEIINEIKFIGTYNKSSTTNTYFIEKISLKNPIIIKDLTKETISSVFTQASANCTFSQEYIFSYKTATQNTRNDLVNAIFETYGMTNECPEGAERYFVDNGGMVDTNLGECQIFKVVEIQDDKVIEFTIRIKSSGNDEAYISKLSDTNNYVISQEKSYEMNGQKVVVEVLSPASLEEEMGM